MRMKARRGTFAGETANSELEISQNAVSGADLFGSVRQ